MDCLRSFSFRVTTDYTFTGAEVKTWILAHGSGFIATSSSSSTYNIQGYKNINVHGIEVVGGVFPYMPLATQGGIPTDWAIDVTLNGTQPLIGGNVTTSPNFYAINPSSSSNLVFPIGKYNNVLKLDSPIESVTSIVLGASRVQGTSVQTAGTVRLLYDLNFIVYYNFEGE